MDETFEAGDNCSIRLSWDGLYDNTSEIMCMCCSEIVYIRNNFMEEGKNKRNSKVRSIRANRKLYCFDQFHLIRYIDH